MGLCFHRRMQMLAHCTTLCSFVRQCQHHMPARPCHRIQLGQRRLQLRPRLRGHFLCGRCHMPCLDGAGEQAAHAFSRTAVKE